MIDILITNHNNHIDLTKFKNIFDTGTSKISSKKKFFTWQNKSGEKIFFFGNIYQNFKKIDLEDPKKSKTLEGSFIIIKVFKNKNINIWTDRFSKEEIFYTSNKNKYFVSTNMDNLIKNIKNISYDKFGISQSLIIYGARPSKKNTFYNNIKRLGYNEILKTTNKGLSIKILNHNFLNSENYSKKSLNNYFNNFIETLEQNSSKDDNIIFLSSGWDSTSILAGLNYIYGKKKIRCLTIKQSYSDKFGVTNVPEIKKAKKIADFYDVDLEIVNLNYLSEDFINLYLHKINNLFRSKNFNMFPGLSHFLLSEKASKIRKSDDTTVFTGEMSDGAHNLGFSQFVSIFHPTSKKYREYSDKMMSYLYGPTFFKSILDNNYNLDPVWQILRQKNTSKLENINLIKSTKKLKDIYLRSFFAQGSRFPMYSIDNEIFLTKKGRINYHNYMIKNYLNTYSKQLNEKNHYSIFLNLYNSFHWQGSTVATLKLGADFHNLNICNPFHGNKIFDFLSKMPEDWGRGLDFNPTKYPLKEILKTKLKYPFELQSGSHAYVYDTNQNFNHVEELLVRSRFKKIIKRKIKNSKILDNLDNNHFNLKYINRLIQSYDDNKKLNLKEINDMGILAANTLIDSY